MSGYECVICSSQLYLSEEEKADFINSLFISEDGDMCVDPNEAWIQDVTTQFRVLAPRQVPVMHVKRMWDRVCKKVKKYQEIAGTKCGHLFHRRCLIKWFEVREEAELPISCPYCTQNLPETNAVFTLKPKWVHASDVGKKTGLPKPPEMESAFFGRNGIRPSSDFVTYLKSFLLAVTFLCIVMDILRYRFPEFKYTK